MFKIYVDIYREMGSPSFEDGETIFQTVSLNPRIRNLILQYKESEEKVGDLDFVFLDGDSVEIEFTAVQYERYALFRDVSHFIENTPSIKKGKLRDNYYIANLNYLSGDDHIPDEIRNINKIAKFIWVLREFVSLSIDKEQSMNGDRIFFLKPSDGKSPQKAAALKITLTADVFAHNLGSFKILEALKKALNEEKTQIEERILLMNTAISQIIDECEDDEADFEYLVKNWSRVNKKYLHDLHAYVSSFSFDAARKKISDGLIESTTKLNNAIGEVGTKLLTVPASIGALIILKDTANLSSFTFGLIGVIVASLIMFRTIWHYENHVNNLMANFSFNLQESTKAKKTFSKIIKDEINRISFFKDNQKKEIKKTFRRYRQIAFLPMILSGWFFIDKFYPYIEMIFMLNKYCYNFNLIEWLLG